MTRAVPLKIKSFAFVIVFFEGSSSGHCSVSRLVYHPHPPSQSPLLALCRASARCVASSRSDTQDRSQLRKTKRTQSAPPGITHSAHSNTTGFEYIKPVAACFPLPLPSLARALSEQYSRASSVPGQRTFSRHPAASLPTCPSSRARPIDFTDE